MIPNTDSICPSRSVGEDAGWRVQIFYPYTSTRLLNPSQNKKATALLQCHETSLVLWWPSIKGQLFSSYLLIVLVEFFRCF